MNKVGFVVVLSAALLGLVVHSAVKKHRLLKPAIAAYSAGDKFTVQHSAAPDSPNIRSGGNVTMMQSGGTGTTVGLGTTCTASGGCTWLAPGDEHAEPGYLGVAPKPASPRPVFITPDGIIYSHIPYAPPDWKKVIVRCLPNATCEGNPFTTAGKKAGCGRKPGWFCFMKD